MKKGYIYLFKRNDGWYKIGRTSNIEQRFSSWRWESSSHKYGMVLLGLVEVDNPRSAEKQFQAIFHDRRTEKRHNGMGPRHELFKLDRSDLSKFWIWADIIGNKTIRAEMNLERRDWLPVIRDLLNA